MARRFATFMVFGPFLVWVTAIILLLPALIRAPNSGELTFMIPALFVIAALGLIPGLLLALADRLMMRLWLSPAPRAAACAALAYPVTVLFLWITLRQVGLLSSFTTELPVSGLFAMIPAAVCSWIAGRG